MDSNDVPTYNKAYVELHKGTRNFRHRGRGVWVEGLPPLGTDTRVAVVGPDAELWKLENMAVFGLVKLSKQAIVHTNSQPNSTAQEPRRSLFMRFKPATPTSAASIHKARIVTLRVPGARLAAITGNQQSAQQNATQAGAVTNPYAAGTAPTTSTPSAQAPFPRAQRVSNRASNASRLVTDRQPSASTPSSAAPSRGTKRRASDELDEPRTGVQRSRILGDGGEELTGGAEDGDSEGDDDDRQEAEGGDAADQK